MSTVRDHDHSQPWDAGDVAALLEYRRCGCTIAYIAERMGRTEAAVRSKLYRLRKAGG